MNKSKILDMFAIALLVLGIILITLDNSVNIQPVIKVYCQSQPDEYSNRIEYVYIFQYIGSWQQKCYITVNNYTSGMTVKLSAGYNVRFNVTVRLNSTFASDDNDAKVNSKVNLIVKFSNGTEVFNVEMQEYAVTSDSNYYYISSYYDWTSNLPIEGETYNVEIKYYAYY